MLRLKLTEELEVQHRDKCQSLEREAELAHQYMLKAKRDLEVQ